MTKTGRTCQGGPARERRPRHQLPTCARWRPTGRASRVYRRQCRRGNESDRGGARGTDCGSAPWWHSAGVEGSFGSIIVKMCVSRPMPSASRRTPEDTVMPTAAAQARAGGRAGEGEGEGGASTASPHTSGAAAGGAFVLLWLDRQAERGVVRAEADPRPHVVHDVARATPCHATGVRLDPEFERGLRRSDRRDWRGRREGLHSALRISAYVGVDGAGAGGAGGGGAATGVVGGAAAANAGEGATGVATGGAGHEDRFAASQRLKSSTWSG